MQININAQIGSVAPPPDSDPVLDAIIAGAPIVGRGWGPEDHYEPEIVQAPTQELYVSPLGSSAGGGAGSTSGNPVNPSDGLAIFKGWANDQHVRVHLQAGFIYPGDWIRPGLRGLSENRPVELVRFGTGVNPVFVDAFNCRQPVNHLYARGIDFADLLAFRGSHLNLYFEDCGYKYETVFEGWDLQQMVRRVTWRKCLWKDIFLKEPRKQNPVGFWLPAGDQRTSGLFTNFVQSGLMEDCWQHHCGWGYGSDPQLSVAFPQPNSAYSHNSYIQKRCLDMTFRRSAFTFGASFGLMLRPGGKVIDCLFADNGIGLNLNGDFTADTNGAHMTLAARNIVWRPHRTWNRYQQQSTDELGATNWGIDAQADKAIAYHNVVAKSMGPGKVPASFPNAHYNDTVVHEWGTQPNQNLPPVVPDLDIPPNLYDLLEADHVAAMASIRGEWIPAYHPN